MEQSTFNKDYDTLNNPEDSSSLSQILVRKFTYYKDHKSINKLSISKPFSSSNENLNLTPKNTHDFSDQKENERTPILHRGKHYKLASLLKNNIKTKSKERNLNFVVKQKKIDVKKIRYDYNGNIINKKNKRKVHITFLDQIKDQPINNIIEIESFKKYNIMIGLPKEDFYYGNVPKCCCLIL